jgi:hypothetical protein
MKFFKKKNVMHIITIMFIVFFLSDRILVIFDKEPVFTFFENYFKDGGTTCKIGLGYSVILWKRLSMNEDNGNEIYGYKIGKEFVYFPMCYLKFYGYDLNPKNELKFISNNEIVDDSLRNKILGVILDNNFLNKFIIPFDILGLFMPIIYSIIIIIIFVYYLKCLIPIIAGMYAQKR